MLQVIDNITVPTTIRSLEFSLNRGMVITDSSLEIEQISDSGNRHSLYRVVLPENRSRLQIRYQGKPVFSGQKSLGQMPQGVLNAKGVYLDGSSAWYPITNLPLTSIDLQVEQPEGWRVLSVGGLEETSGITHWRSRIPHDDIYLVAGPFTRYAKKHGDVDLSVWLLTEDRALADRYLAPMADYLDHYSRQIGHYPFAKFAVVENPWQTGFGMPSFTLLGSRVLRLPFIPFTSLPHEIAHNWLGNGIWVDYEKGNWSEGLTAYLADHWMKERRAKGSQHRQKSLQRFSNFAAEGKDAPLLDFVSRHNDTSQAIGYDKSMMLFHMIRRALGDRGFSTALQRLWQSHRFQRIGFEQTLQTLLYDRPELLARFRPWLNSSHMPRIHLQKAEHAITNGQHQLRLLVENSGKARLTFQLPIYVTTTSTKVAEPHWVTIKESAQEIILQLDRAPLRVDVDPAFDVLRHLDRSEQAPALNQLFAGRTALIMPSEAPSSSREAWQRFAKTLQARYPQLVLISDQERMPENIENRLILGWGNLLLKSALPGFHRGSQRLTLDGLEVESAAYPRKQNALVLVSNSAAGAATGFIGASTPGEIDLLARKLPHYGSYGRLVFEANTVKNLRRDVLAPRYSVLSKTFTNQFVTLNLPTEPVLGTAEND